MKRYSLGLQGMTEDPHGIFVLYNDMCEEVKEWEKASESNYELAENLLKQQDDEIAEKNKLIVELQNKIKELNA